MSRTFDFHEIGLVLEIECPGSAEVNIVQCSRPQNSKLHLVVDVDKIEPGGTREIDIGEDVFNSQAMFLTKRDRGGMDRWWEFNWKNS
jgi:hypothetical protein